ncbi:MAG: 3-hydroxyacyl-ACP dehydratase FabZ [Alphaproteobacteria bacterium]|nr:3-hydroxyacyl-ACP dehydratase FabZ [Alphaproteobacteria bacterium]
MPLALRKRSSEAAGTECEMSQAKTPSTIDITGIMKRIPHRYPMLLIDRVVDIVTAESCTGIKNVSVNEPFFQGHFPGHPIMPGVLIIEAMAQTAATLVVDSLKGVDSDTHVVYFMTIESARFRKPVVPGDQLHIKVKKERHRGNVWKFRGEAFVDDALCAEAVYTAMLVPDAEKAAE